MRFSVKIELIHMAIEQFLRPDNVFIIAEAGVNHNGDFDLAKSLVRAAAGAGADAVKFQSFKAERLVTRAAPKADYQKISDGARSQYDMLKALELSDEAVSALKDEAKRFGLIFMSTPFDEIAATWLDRLGVQVFKIGSGDLTNLPLLALVAGFNKPMIISTGMAAEGEIDEALAAVRSAGNPDIILLHCVSAYPADPKDANLRAIQTMKDRFNLPVGFSDHTPGIAVSIAAAALGACVIEKHLTVDKDLPGPDHRASLDPDEFKALVEGLRIVTAALGSGKKEPTPAERKIAQTVRKSVVAQAAIPKGALITAEMVTLKRPAGGIPPKDISKVIGAVAARDIGDDEVITWDDIRR
ncbi:MAG: N-acetylneuraminate synthase [Actinomycetota bacterium]|nr:N-acetylneuraminate synthase [Actinomycetota bacterium]